MENYQDYSEEVYNRNLPIWKNYEIVAKFIVVNVDGTYSGTYSDTQVTLLNELKDLTSKKNPLVLIGNDGLFANLRFE